MAHTENFFTSKLTISQKHFAFLICVTKNVLNVFVIKCLKHNNTKQHQNTSTPTSYNCHCFGTSTAVDATIAIANTTTNGPCAGSQVQVFLNGLHLASHGTWSAFL